MLPQIAEIQRQLEDQHYVTDRAIATTIPTRTGNVHVVRTFCIARMCGVLPQFERGLGAGTSSTPTTS